MRILALRVTVWCPWECYLTDAGFPSRGTLLITSLTPIRLLAQNPAQRMCALSCGARLYCGERKLMGVLNSRTRRMNKILVRAGGRKRARKREMTTGPEVRLGSQLLGSEQQRQNQRLEHAFPFSPPFKHPTPTPISTLILHPRICIAPEIHPPVTPLPSQFEPGLPKTSDYLHLLSDSIPVATRGWQC